MMITYLQTYRINVPIHEISKKFINYSNRISMPSSTHTKRIVEIVDKCFEM